MKRVSRHLVGNLFGQGLNFLAMLVPIWMGRLDAVTALVLVSAVAGISSQVGMAAFPSIFPTVKSGAGVKASLQASSLFLVFCSAIPLLAFVFLSRIDSGRDWQFLMWASLMSVSLGGYQFCLTGLIRLSNAGLFSEARCVYGVLNLVTTFLVSMWAPAQDSLVWAVIGVNLAASLYVIVRGKHALRSVRLLFAGVDLRAIVGYLRVHSHATASTLIAGLAFQSTSLVLPLLGLYADAWAVVLRLSGGFSTVCQQVFAPRLEMRLGRARRGGEEIEARRFWLEGTLTGVLCSGLSFVAVMSVVAMTSSTEVTDAMLLQFSLVALMLTLGMVGPAPLWKILLMSDRGAWQLGWASTKFATTIVCVASLESYRLMLGLAVCELTWGLVYLILARSALSRLRVAA